VPYQMGMYREWPDKGIVEKDFTVSRQFITSNNVATSVPKGLLMYDVCVCVDRKSSCLHFGEKI
jgi:hypothetical protein